MDYSDRIKQLRQIESNLRNEAWFSDGWQVTVALWPDAEKSSCAIFQLFRNGWFNEDTKGIHIETWLTISPIEDQEVPILMHILHKKKFPGGQDANAVSKPLVSDPEAKKMIKAWGGYKIGKGGMTPFRVNKKFTETNLITGLTQEFSKVRAIGGFVDKYVQCLVG